MSDETPNAPKPVIPGIKPGIPGVTSAANPAAPDAGDTSRTVRLKPITVPPPVTAPPSITAPIPGADPIPDGPRPPTPAQVQAAKSKTSRISLEQAISMDSQTPRSTQPVEAANVLSAPAPGAPRTIRLKRPTEMPTLKVNAVPSPGAPAAVPSDTPATLPTVAEDPDSAVTQKRQLKVRRPGAPAITIGGGSQESGDLPEGMTPIDTTGMVPISFSKPDKVNPTFLVFAILALLIGGGLVGFYCWQLFDQPSYAFWFQQVKVM
ncbi:MAG: hypothetical protein FWF96_02670 [Kiritimatiellaeota bacterium]|nr:hypothetical protein [Kiritimatiellota bacterium]